MKLHYSILRFHPIASSSTPITLGILFHEPSLDFREFRYTHDLSRLSQLYPDVDIEIVEKLLRGIREDIKSERFYSKGFDTEDYTRFYINDFHFGDIERVECNDLDEMIEQIVQRKWR